MKALGFLSAPLLALILLPACGDDGGNGSTGGATDSATGSTSGGTATGTTAATDSGTSGGTSQGTTGATGSTGASATGGSTGGDTGTSTGTAGGSTGGSSGGVTNTPPVATITSPAMDDMGQNLDHQYDGHDDVLDLWYADIDVTGMATDAEDGNLTGTSLVWTTDRDDIHPDANLGTGEALTIRLYSNVCTGVMHEVSLTATDSGGLTDEALRKIWIWVVC